MNRRRVVVTGLGTLNPLAQNVDDFWTALLEGRSGAAPVTLFDASRLPTHFAAEVKDFDLSKYLGDKAASHQTGSLNTQYALAAAQMASGLCHVGRSCSESAPIRKNSSSSGCCLRNAFSVSIV